VTGRSTLGSSGGRARPQQEEGRSPRGRGGARWGADGSGLAVGGGGPRLRGLHAGEDGAEVVDGEAAVGLAVVDHVVDLLVGPHLPEPLCAPGGLACARGGGARPAASPAERNGGSGGASAVS
jgi:hypothetical protein